MLLSKIMNADKVKARIGFDSENNIIVNENEDRKILEGFSLIELDLESYNEIVANIDKLSKDDKYKDNGYKFLYDIIPFVTDITCDMEYEDFEFKLTTGNATVVDFIGIISTVYKDLEKFQKSYIRMSNTVNEVEALASKLKKISDKDE